MTAGPDDIGPDGRVRLRCYLLSANSLWFAAGCQGRQGSLNLSCWDQGREVVRRRHHLDAAQHKPDRDDEQQERAQEGVTGRPGWALRAAGDGLHLHGRRSHCCPNGYGNLNGNKNLRKP
jgi:hypothetical protein